MGYLTSGLSIANIEGIPSVTRVTLTVRIVIVNSTGGMNTTYSWAWISTFLLYTSEIAGTFLIDCTLRFTFNVRISLKTGKTFA